MVEVFTISLSNFGMGGHTQNQLGNVSRFVSLEEFNFVFDSSISNGGTRL